jgi:hypothetical protein
MNVSAHPTRRSSELLPVVTVVVFIGHTITHPAIAVGVLYVPVVLLAARFCEQRTLPVVAGACIARRRELRRDRGRRGGVVGVVGAAEGRGHHQSRPAVSTVSGSHRATCLASALSVRLPNARCCSRSS